MRMKGEIPFLIVADFSSAPRQFQVDAIIQQIEEEDRREMDERRKQVRYFFSSVYYYHQGPAPI